MTKLTPEQRVQYQESGYYFPVPALTDSEVLEYRKNFFTYLSLNRPRLAELAVQKQYLVFSETHALLRWVYRIVSHPNILDAVESILGPNLLVWDSAWFSKMPAESKYVAWHQDSLYFGLYPLDLITTAWIALSESTPENGCLRVIPRSQKHVFPHSETQCESNVLSRGQEITVEVDESKAVDLILRPGQISLHHPGIVHGSNKNRSDKPRIGLAVRYVTPEVITQGPQRQFGMLVRGKDEVGGFELLQPPQADEISPESTVQSQILERMGIGV